MGHDQPESGDGDKHGAMGDEQHGGMGDEQYGGMGDDVQGNACFKQQSGEGKEIKSPLT